MWIPKHGRKVLYGEAGTEVRDILRRLVEAKDGAKLLEGVVARDHICLRMAPKHSAARVMGYLKGKSALMPFDHHPEWRNRTGRDRTFWARSHYVGTAGPNETTIRKYVRNQEDASRIAQWGTDARGPAATATSQRELRT